MKTLIASLIIVYVAYLFYDIYYLNYFDYIVIGGGTSGLLVANRLISSNYSVLVLEAGPDHHDDEGINVAGNFGTMVGSKYDWNYNVNGIPQPTPRGRTLGGSSAINYLLWNRPADIEIDEWEKLGAEGWNWNSVLESMKKTENFHAPSEQTLKVFHMDLGEGLDEQYYGHDGAIHLTYPEFATEMDKACLLTYNKLGIPINGNPASGNNVGANISPISSNPKDKTRSYSKNAYLDPIINNKYLNVITDATVSRILTEKRDNDNVDGVAVEYNHNGKRYVANANREIILASGTIATPQILELSGIGSPDILNKFGIDVVVNLPGVGSNLQDHSYTTMTFEVDDNVENLDKVHFNTDVSHEEHEKLRKSQFSLLEQANVCISYLTPNQLMDDSYKQELEKLIENVKSYEGEYRDQYESLLKYLENPSVTQFEHVFVGFFADIWQKPDLNKRYLTIITGNQHPFSRGSVHIQSTDPFKQPDINVNYIEHPIDKLFQREAAKFGRYIMNTKPLSNVVKKEILPGQNVQTNEEWDKFIEETIFCEYHPIGTSKMGRKENNGVVDNKLKVYGTNNIRIVDASVMPLHVSAHIQSLVYGIAYKASEIILNE